jgi:hypothetical protein
MPVRILQKAADLTLCNFSNQLDGVVSNSRKSCVGCQICSDKDRYSSNLASMSSLRKGASNDRNGNPDSSMNR